MQTSDELSQKRKSSIPVEMMKVFNTGLVLIDVEHVRFENSIF